MALSAPIELGPLGADFVDISVYGLLLLILIVRPTGIFGAAGTRARS